METERAPPTADCQPPSSEEAHLRLAGEKLGADTPPSGGDGGTPPGGGYVPNPPSMSIHYVSDQNPYDVLVAVTYSSNTQYMRLRRDGVEITRFAPSTMVSLGSLDNMAAQNFFAFAIEACNVDGCAEGDVYVSRSTTYPEAVANVIAYFFDAIPDPQGGVSPQLGSAGYLRRVRGRYVTTGYNVVTSGARNGQFQCVRVNDGLFWTDITTRPPIWDGTYFMIPYNSYWEQPFNENEPYGCSLSTGYPHSDVKCTIPATFGGGGHSRVTFLRMGSAFWLPPPPPVGDLDMGISPCPGCFSPRRA